MAYNVTGLDANGRVTPKGTNVVIPPESAGIGDLVYNSGSTYKVIGCGTASGASISIGGTTYNIYGIIYGFVNGEAMVVAPQELGAKTWGAYVSGMPTIGANTVLMRNGNKAQYYAQMNTSQNSNYIKGGSSAPGKLTSAYQATNLTAETFATDAPAAVKQRYNTWEEYIRQTLRVQGAPGSPFGAASIDVKVHEYGRWFGRTYAGSQATGTALRACYDYGAGNGTWWLPSMFELAELMIDEHLDKLNENNASVFGSISKSSSRWSCVPSSSGSAWDYSSLGVSYSVGFASTWAVRPVTLFKLE